MRRQLVYGVAVVCSSVSCGGGSSNVPSVNSSAPQPAASECIANAEQLRLKIYYSPKEDALDNARVEYRAEWDDHAEQVWRLEHSKVVDDVFITGTLTEGSAHLRAFDDEKQRFYRRSQWLCE